MKEIWGETLTMERAGEKKRRRGQDHVGGRSIRSLAEAIILQSMEDMWNTAHRNESLQFFGGEGFDICAELAGLGPDEQKKIIGMLAEPKLGR